MTITLDELRQAAQRYRIPTHASLNEAKRSGRRTAFLCHSHHDAALAKGLAQKLAEEGVGLYIDWQDVTMPETPNRQTAENLQARIKGCDTFLFLATEKSMSSRWCPWEIGYADAEKGKDWIVVVPTRDRYSTQGSEYLQLYRHIERNNAGGFSVFTPGAQFGSTLSSAL